MSKRQEVNHTSHEKKIVAIALTSFESSYVAIQLVHST